jgi:hypothetical protein
MDQGTQGYSLTKKTEGRKSRDTVSLININNKEKVAEIRLWDVGLDLNVEQLL